MKIRLVSSQTVLADLIRSGAEVGNEDSGVVAALSTDNFAAGQGIHSTQFGVDGHFAVYPTRFQGDVIRIGEI